MVLDVHGEWGIRSWKIDINVNMYMCIDINVNMYMCIDIHVNMYMCIHVGRLGSTKSDTSASGRNFGDQAPIMPQLHFQSCRKGSITPPRVSLSLEASHIGKYWDWTLRSQVNHQIQHHLKVCVRSCPKITALVLSQK